MKSYSSDPKLKKKYEAVKKSQNFFDNWLIFTYFCISSTAYLTTIFPDNRIVNESMKIKINSKSKIKRILNKKTDDDFTDIKGRQAIRADLFAASWATDNSCKNVPKAISRGKCATNAETEEQARRKCQHLFMKPFRL